MSGVVSPRRRRDGTRRDATTDETRANVAMVVDAARESDGAREARRERRTMVGRLCATANESFRRLITRVLRAGDVPRHVAVIMDGNRRFACHAGVAYARGHARGADVLTATCAWCFELGVQTLSVYALSTENFKRSSEELEALFDLACGKLGALVEDEGLRTRGARVHVSGDLGALPERVRAKALEAMERTKTHRGPMLNVCLAYTGREDAVRAVMATRREVRDGTLDARDVDETTLGRRLHGAERETTSGEGMSEVDLLVRTSGETRLSDFMLVNARFAKLVFVEVLWPDFTFMDMVHAIWQYQRGASDLKRARAAYEASLATSLTENDEDAVVADIRLETQTRDDETLKTTSARDARAQKRRARRLVAA